MSTETVSDPVLPKPEDASELALTRTEQANTAAKVAPPKGGKFRKWWKRRPIRRFMVVIHRWPSLILGIFLVIETTSGAVLLYQAEIFKTAHPAMYHHTTSPTPISAEDAITIVKKADPDFAPIWAGIQGGVYFVGNSDYATVYSVDPGNGHLNGKINRDHGIMGFLENLHDCALNCEGYTGYQSWLAGTIPTGGITFLNEITWGGLILGVLGLLLVLLAITGLFTWWPGRKKMSHGFRVRWGKGRFARDYDLHNVIGIIGLAFLLMWGITGAAFEFPVVQKAWLFVTGGSQPDPAEFDFTPKEAAKGAKTISVDEAIAAAQTKVPGGKVVMITLPTEDVPYYDIDFKSGYGSYAHQAVYPSDAYVYVNPHDATDIKAMDTGKGDPAPNRFYDKFLEPTHFGWNVNGWWRIIWLILGLTPLLLFVTSISTWLYRHGTKKRRRQARAARALAATSAAVTTSAAHADPPSFSDEAIARQEHDREPT